MKQPKRKQKFNQRKWGEQRCLLLAPSQIKHYKRARPSHDLSSCDLLLQGTHCSECLSNENSLAGRKQSRGVKMCQALVVISPTSGKDKEILMPKHVTKYKYISIYTWTEKQNLKIYTVYDIITVPPGRGCRPEVYHGKKPLGFLRVSFRVSFRVCLGFHLGFYWFYHSFEEILLSRLTWGVMSDVGFRVQDLGFRIWSFMFWKEISSASRPPGRHCNRKHWKNAVNHNISGQHPRPGGNCIL